MADVAARSKLASSTQIGAPSPGAQCSRCRSRGMACRVAAMCWRTRRRSTSPDRRTKPPRKRQHRTDVHVRIRTFKAQKHPSSARATRTPADPPAVRPWARAGVPGTAEPARRRPRAAASRPCARAGVAAMPPATGGPRCSLAPQTLHRTPPSTRADVGAGDPGAHGNRKRVSAADGSASRRAARRASRTGCRAVDHRLESSAIAARRDSASTRGRAEQRLVPHDRRTADLYRHRTMSAGVEIGLFRRYRGGMDRWREGPRPSIKIDLGDLNISSSRSLARQRQRLARVTSRND